jgi:hypothetical protein
MLLLPQKEEILDSLSEGSEPPTSLSAQDQLHSARVTLYGTPHIQPDRVRGCDFDQD